MAGAVLCTPTLGTRREDGSHVDVFGAISGKLPQFFGQATRVEIEGGCGDSSLARQIKGDSKVVSGKPRMKVGKCFRDAGR